MDGGGRWARPRTASPSNRHRDLGRKRELYEAAGAAEYWFVDREERRVLSQLLGPSGYGEPAVVEAGGTLTSPLLEGVRARRRLAPRRVAATPYP